MTKRQRAEAVYKIKTLVWVKQPDPEHWRAESVIGSLDLRAVGWYWFLKIHGDAIGHYGTDVIGAKKKAFVEYKRILTKALTKVKSSKGK